MKIILIHGSLQELVLNKIAQIKKEFDPICVTETDGNFQIELSSQNLFSEKRLIIFENPDIKIIEKAFLINNPDLTIIFKFPKTLEKSSEVLKKFIESKAEIFSFEEASQTSIFPFLDMLGNLNNKAFIEFEKIYKEFGGQYILTMLAYFLRRMILPPNSDFLKQKISSQKKNFPIEKIQKLYKEIIETDFKIKQGLYEEKLGVTILIQKILN